MSATGCICPKRLQRWTDDATCMTCGRDLVESQIQDVVRAVLCSGDTGIVLWRNNIGVARYTDDEHTVTAVVKYGVCNPGGADLIGGAQGRFLAVETKARIGRQSPAQREFQRIVEDVIGGIYAIVRSEAQARALLARLRG